MLTFYHFYFVFIINASQIVIICLLLWSTFNNINTMFLFSTYWLCCFFLCNTSDCWRHELLKNRFGWWEGRMRKALDFFNVLGRFSNTSSFPLWKLLSLYKVLLSGLTMAYFASMFFLDCWAAVNFAKLGFTTFLVSKLKLSLSDVSHESSLPDVLESLLEGSASEPSSTRLLLWEVFVGLLSSVCSEVSCWLLQG